MICLVHFLRLLAVCLPDAQGSVATYARCGGIFNISLTANLQRNLQVKTFLNRLRFDRSMVISLWPRSFGPPCIPRDGTGVGPGS